MRVIVTGTHGCSSTRVGLWWLDHSSRLPRLARLRSLVSEREAERARRLARAVDRERFLDLHVFLRLVLAEQTGIPPNALRFASAPCTRCGGAHGKPYLEGGGVRYNLAHGERTTVVAVSRDAEVGVDVADRTAVDAEPDLSRLASSLHPREAAAVARAGLEGIRRARGAFVRTWARKEAVARAVGAGLTVPLGDYDTTGATAFCGGERVVVADVPLPVDAACAVAVRAPGALPALEFEVHDGARLVRGARAGRTGASLRRFGRVDVLVPCR
jgi:4'-phosphopantetheinyl transferase